MAVLAVTITVYAELPGDGYQETLDAIKNTIMATFSDYGLQDPIIRTRNSIPASIADQL